MPATAVGHKAGPTAKEVSRRRPLGPLSGLRVRTRLAAPLAQGPRRNVTFLGLVTWVFVTVARRSPVTHRVPISQATRRLVVRVTLDDAELRVLGSRAAVVAAWAGARLALLRRRVSVGAWPLVANRNTKPLKRVNIPVPHDETAASNGRACIPRTGPARARARACR